MKKGNKGNAMRKGETMKMRYFIGQFYTPSDMVPICDPKGYENLGFAQLLAIEISKSSTYGICVEQRFGNEVVFAELFSNGRKISA